MDAPAQGTARTDRESAWELAKTRFINDLEPEERQLYEHATLENLYYATSNINRSDAESSRTRAVIQKLEPLVTAISAYGSALDNFAQIAPLYLAPIWGSIRVLLVVAEAHSKFYAKIVDCLARVGDILPRFRDYERIYDLEKHARLTQALSNAYLDLIVLCTQFRSIIRDHRASKVRRILRPLSINHQFDDAIEKFRRHRKEVEKEAHICHLIEAAEERDKRIMLAAAQRRQTLLSRLSSINCTRRHVKLQSSRHEGTGVWLSKDVEYVKWMDSGPGPAVLCCHGIPGCGKSVLASTVIDSFKKNDVMAFYYCDYADKRTLFPSNIFGTLARQILEQRATIAESLADAIEQADHDGDRLTDPSKALHIFQQSVKTASHPLYLILDGLDECTEHSQRVICDGLRQLLNHDKSSIKLLITARSELDTLFELDPSVHKSSILVSSAAIALDIEAYVRASTRNRLFDGSLVLQDPQLQDLIVQKLVDGAKGMFLWVEFQLNDLCDAETDRGIKEVLDNLPQSLCETYDRLLARIEGVERATMIERMFKWLVCARQPLHVNELREGIAFTIDDTEWSQDKIITDLGRLIRTCSNLVIVDSSTRVVQLAHYTVEQYLLQNKTTRFHFTRQEADIMAGEFCISYLSFADFETRITHYRDNTNTDLVALERLASRRSLLSPDQPGRTAIKIWNAFRTSDASPISLNMTQFASTQPKVQDLSQFECLPYVSKNWLKHSASFPAEPRRAKDYSLRRQTLFRDLVLEEKKLPFQIQPWISFLPTDNSILIRALVGWGLMENHPLFIMMAREIVIGGDNSENALFTAGWQNLNDDFDQAWDQICQGNDSFIEFPKTELEECLKDSYALDIPINSWLFSRLLLACRKGHIEAIKACLPQLHRAKFVQFCAIVAVIHGQLSLLETLLLPDNILNPSIRIEHTGLYLNALEHALISRRSNIIQFLLDAGQKIELFRDESAFYSLLDDAVDNVHPGRVYTLFLILHGLLDSRFILRQLPERQILDHARVRDALLRASSRGHHDIVTFMLRHGVNPDGLAGSNMSPLFTAISNSHHATVKTLLEHGASIGFTEHGFPLTFAAFLGDTRMVELLQNYDKDNGDYAGRSDIFASLPQLDTEASPHIYLCPSPLYMACRRGNVEVVKQLIVRGKPVDEISPTSIVHLSRRGDKFVCETVPYPVAKTLYQQVPHAAKPAWETAMATALSQGHKAVVDILVQHHRNPLNMSVPAPGIPTPPRLKLEEFISTKVEISPFGIAILHVLDINRLDATTDLELLVAAGIDPLTVQLGEQSLFTWALDNRKVRLHNAIQQRSTDHLSLLFHCTTDLGTQDLVERKRMYRVLSNMSPPMDFKMLTTRVLPQLGIEEGGPKWLDILFNVFLVIICYRIYLVDHKHLANLIIGVIHPKFRQMAYMPLATQEMEAIKSAYGNIDIPENIISLRELFASLYLEDNGLRDLSLCVAINDKKYELVQVLCRRWSGNCFQSADNPLVLAIRTKAPIDILALIIEVGGTTALNCCAKDEKGKTALDVAVENDYAIELLQSVDHSTHHKCRYRKS